jgi:hypothetical protein
MKVLKVLSSLMVIGFLASCATAPKGMVSDSKHDGKTKIVYEVAVNTTKEKAWAILKDYDNLKWASTVKDAHYIGKKRNGVGMTRHCDLADGGYVVEEISKWDEGNSFTYLLTDASDPITPDSYANWSVKKMKDGKSLIRFEVHYELGYGFIGDAMNGLMAKAKFANSIKGFMHELKDYAEHKNMMKM